GGRPCRTRHLTGFWAGCCRACAASPDRCRHWGRGRWIPESSSGHAGAVIMASRITTKGAPTKEARDSAPCRGSGKGPFGESPTGGGHQLIDAGAVGHHLFVAQAAEGRH